jgi:hypothetical protein
MRSAGGDASRPLDPPGVEWPKPSRRARAMVAALAILLALLTAVVVSLAWKRVTPPRAPQKAVEVKLIAAPSTAPAVARRPGATASSAAP